MHVLLTCFGTRGDVQPYAALAGALVRAGHRASLATAKDSATWRRMGWRSPAWARRCCG